MPRAFRWCRPVVFFFRATHSKQEKNKKVGDAEKILFFLEENAKDNVDAEVGKKKVGGGGAAAAGKKREPPIESVKRGKRWEKGKR